MDGTIGSDHSEVDNAGIGILQCVTESVDLERQDLEVLRKIAPRHGLGRESVKF